MAKRSRAIRREVSYEWARTVLQQTMLTEDRTFHARRGNFGIDGRHRNGLQDGHQIFEDGVAEQEEYLVRNPDGNIPSHDNNQVNYGGKGPNNYGENEHRAESPRTQKVLN